MGMFGNRQRWGGSLGRTEDHGIAPFGTAPLAAWTGGAPVLCLSQPRLHSAFLAAPRFTFSFSFGHLGCSQRKQPVSVFIPTVLNLRISQSRHLPGARVSRPHELLFVQMYYGFLTNAFELSSYGSRAFPVKHTRGYFLSFAAVNGTLPPRFSHLLVRFSRVVLWPHLLTGCTLASRPDLFTPSTVQPEALPSGGERFWPWVGIERAGRRQQLYPLCPDR